jgi:hypothetical protein
LRYLNTLVYLKRNGSPSIVGAQVESAETAHFLAAVILLPYMAYACGDRRWGAVAGLALVQIGFNLYPIMHLVGRGSESADCYRSCTCDSKVFAS